MFLVVSFKAGLIKLYEVFYALFSFLFVRYIYKI